MSYWAVTFKYCHHRNDPDITHVKKVFGEVQDAEKYLEGMMNDKCKPGWSYGDSPAIGGFIARGESNCSTSKVIMTVQCVGGDI